MMMHELANFKFTGSEPCWLQCM